TTQVLLALGLVAADWSVFYRLFSPTRLDYAVLTRCFLRETLAPIPPEEPYVALVDGVHCRAPAHACRAPPGSSARVRRPGSRASTARSASCIWRPCCRAGRATAARCRCAGYRRCPPTPCR